MAQTKIHQRLYEMLNIRNFIDNGDFDIWQRAASFLNPPHATKIVDRWGISRSGTSVINISSSSTTRFGTTGFGQSCYMECTSVTPVAMAQIAQSVEDWKPFIGKTVSASVWVKVNLSGFIIRLDDIAGSTADSTAHTGDNTWQKLTVSLPITTGASGVYVRIGFPQGFSATFACFIDEVMLNVGDEPVDFVTTPPAEDWERCLRYYEIGRFQQSHRGRDVGTGAKSGGGTTNLRVVKASTPTVTIVSSDIVPDGSSTPTTGWGLYTGGDKSIIYTECSKTSAEVPGRVQFDWTAEVT